MVFGGTLGARSKSAPRTLRAGLITLSLLLAAPLAHSAPALNAAPPSASALSAPDIRLQTPAGRSNYRVCKSLEQCLDILERHGADEFDYALLARSFERYDQKGRDKLWAYVAKGEAVVSRKESPAQLANRALDILSRNTSILPPAGQRRAADLWKRLETTPLEPRFAARILVNNLSSLARSAAVQTLGSRNPEIARRAREIINLSVSRKLDFPMPQADLAPLLRAVKAKPEPALIALLALYEAETSSPGLTAILRSGDAPSVAAAYSALYAQDPETAFKAMIGTLYKLGPDEGEAALGLAALLAGRHPLRSDGFYMTFARDLMQDSQMSDMGRLAGFDALMRSFGPDAFSTKGIAKDISPDEIFPHYAAGLSALRGKIIPKSYLSAAMIFGAADKGQERWLSRLDAAAVHPVSRIASTEIAGAVEGPLARSITARARADTQDYRLLIAGLLGGAAQPPPAAELSSALNEAAAHPVSLVRGAAQIGLSALKAKDPRKAVLAAQANLLNAAKQAERPAAFCQIKTANLRALTRPMPFYDAASLAKGQLSERAYLTSAARHSAGWLAGYSRPGDGGLVAYQNDGTQAVELFTKNGFGPQSVIAVNPAQAVPLGQTAKHFWVIGQSLAGADVSLFRVTQNSPSDFKIIMRAVLPALPEKINIAAGEELQIGFGRANPPLSVLPSGEIKRSCP